MLAAAVCNLFGDKKGRPAQPADFFASVEYVSTAPGDDEFSARIDRAADIMEAKPDAPQ